MSSTKTKQSPHHRENVDKEKFDRIDDDGKHVTSPEADLLKAIHRSPNQRVSPTASGELRIVALEFAATKPSPWHQKHEEQPERIRKQPFDSVCDTRSFFVKEKLVKLSWFI